MRRTHILFLFVILFLLAVPAGAQDNRYVATTGDDTGNDCLTQGSPCETIGYAIEQAVAGDIIQIADGEYTETLTIDKNLTLQGENRAGTILQAWATPCQEDDLADCDATDRVITPSFIDFEITLSDLTIRHGVTTGSGGGFGHPTNRGVLMASSVTFRDNIASSQGGGVHLAAGSEAVFELVSFEGNAGSTGGGMYVTNTELTLNFVGFGENFARNRDGGALNAQNSNSTLTLVEFLDNEATGIGGGMYALSGTLVLERADFKSNTSGRWGGGLSIVGTDNAEVRHVVFDGNAAVSSGGGLHKDTRDDFVLENAVFTDNTVECRGGGMINRGGEPLLVNVLFSGNAQTSSSDVGCGQRPGGGGLYNTDTAVTLVNLTVSDNLSAITGTSVGGGGIYNYYSPGVDMTLINSIVWNNTAETGNDIYHDVGTSTLVYSLYGDEAGDIEGSATFSIDNYSLTGDPLFTDPGNGDFTLQPASFAINAGSNSDYTAAGGDLPNDLDLAGNPRLYDDGDPNTDDIIDMGAWEFQGEPETPLTLRMDEGWRMLSSPIAGQTYGQMLDPLWTQGVSGADYEGDENTFPNVYTWDLTSPETCLEGDCPEWLSVDLSRTDPIQPGSGFIIFVFSDDNFDGSPEGFDKSLTLTGTSHSGNVSPPMNSNPDGWTLAGNPYRLPVAFGALDKTNLTNVAYVYDPNLTEDDVDDGDLGPTNGNVGGWRTTDGNFGDIPSGNIAPGQGFFVQNDGNPGSLTFTEDSKITNGNFYGKEKQLRDFVRLEVQGESLYNSTWIRFSEDGALDQTTGEALELQPLSANYAILGARKADGVLMDIAHFPLTEQDLEIPLAVQATQPGEFTLRTTDLDLPPGMTLYLYDTQTGESMPIGENFEYRFELNVEKATKNSLLERGRISACGDAGVCSPPFIQPFDGSSMTKTVATNTDRFLITTRPGGPAGELPDEVALGQNYPNPFNPSTVISYQLPVNSDVRLEVYDMLGRNVATLVDGQVSAGRHQVNFDGSNLSSGVYLYRLQAGSAIFTKKLTLIK